MWHWINPEKFRYYQADLVMDLFGDWTLVYCWGGLGSRRSGYRLEGVSSYAEGLGRIDALNRRRRQRGYVAVGSFKDWVQQIAGMRSSETPLHRRPPRRCPLSRELTFLEET